MSKDPDDIDRKLAELYREVSGPARFAEPSAAERAAATRTTSARKTRPPRRGGARLKRWGILALIVVVAGAIGWFRLTSSRSPAVNDTQPVTSGPVPALSQPGPPADPFAGSPAQGYADASAGIVVPAAHPVGRFSAAQVAAAYAKARQLLIAADLNWPTLHGGAPDAFASLLVPQERTNFVHGLDKVGLDKQGYTLSTRQWVTSFAPGSTQFITPTVKVHGVMSASSATNGSGQVVLRIQVNYLFVYAVEPPHAPADWMRVVIHAAGPMDFATWDDPGGALEPWVEFVNGNAGGRCGIGDGYIHPDYPNTAPGKVKPTGPAINPYALSTSGPITSCGMTTGT